MDIVICSLYIYNIIVYNGMFIGFDEVPTWITNKVGISYFLHDDMIYCSIWIQIYPQSVQPLLLDD